MLTLALRMLKLILTTLKAKGARLILEDWFWNLKKGYMTSLYFFSSLYPLIIQEYNICLTTVEKTQYGSIPSLPTSKTAGVLPKLLKILVERRKKVMEWLKSASGLKVQLLDIQQQALKLTANSIYECLGFSNSRFMQSLLLSLKPFRGEKFYKILT